MHITALIGSLNSPVDNFLRHRNKPYLSLKDWSKRGLLANSLKMKIPPITSVLVRTPPVIKQLLRQPFMIPRPQHQALILLILTIEIHNYVLQD